jgi:hypothetical protein
MVTWCHRKDGEQDMLGLRNEILVEHPKHHWSVRGKNPS